jgi:hypothetical protein
MTTKLQEVTRQLIRQAGTLASMANELAALPNQHEAELWKDFYAGMQEHQRIFAKIQELLTAKVPERGGNDAGIPGLGLETWERH